MNATKKYLFLFLTLFSLRAAAQQSTAVRFIKNMGQWDAAVKYRAEIPGGFLYLKKQGLTYVFIDAEAIRSRHASGSGANARTTATSDVVNAHAVEVAFEGASEGVTFTENHPSEVRYNYFYGNDASHWATNVPSVSEVIYHDIYPGVDFKMYAFRQSLKYEFVVSPKADASKIKMKYRGAESLKLADNQLVIKTSLNSFQEQKPYTFQEINNKTREISTQFRVENNTVSFDFPKGYDSQNTLTIDPELVFSTYSGSYSDNWGHTATYDDQGNLYTAGTVFNPKDFPESAANPPANTPSFPSTTGAFQTAIGGWVDLAIMKFSPDGSKLLYATYMGGAFSDLPHSMIVNSVGELLIFGTTSSLNFPITTGAYQSRFGGGVDVEPISGLRFHNGSDAFVAKLNATGSQLLASTFVGGNGNDGICRTLDYAIQNYGDEFRGEVVVDDKNNVYVATSTNSTNFPLVKPAISSIGGRQDAVMFKLSSDLRTLMYSSYLGGAGSDAAYGIKWAPSGAVYVSGITRSVNLPSKTGVFKGVIGGLEDGFVAKFANDQLEQISYLGTNFDDAGYLVDVDKDENVYVLGLTYGAYPVSTGVYNTARGGQFIQVLDKNLSKPVWSTTIGSGRPSPDISPTAFLVNDCANIYIAGWGGVVNSKNGYIPQSSTTGLPVTEDAFKKTTSGNNFYLAILEKNAKSLLYATFFGSEPAANPNNDRGDHVDGGTSRFSKSGIVYHATCACGGSRFPSTPAAWSKNNLSGNCNNAAFKFDIDNLRASFDAYEGTRKDVTSGCAPLTLDFLNTSVGGKTYTWDVQGNNISRDPAKATYTFNQPGEYKVTLKAFNALTCSGQDVATKTIKVGVSKAAVSGDSTVCSDVGVPLKATGGIKYVWTPAVGLSNANIANPIAKVKVTTTFTVQVTDSVCTVPRTVTVKIDNTKPDFGVLKDTTICGGRTAILRAVGNAPQFKWSPAITLSDSLGKQVTAKPLITTIYTVEGQYTDGCRPTKTVTVRVDNTKPDFRVSRDTTICEGQSVKLSVQGGATVSWITLNNSSDRNPTVTPSQTTTYTVVANYADGCQPRQNVTVTIEKGPTGVDFDAAMTYRCGAPTTVQLSSKTSSASRYEWTVGNNAPVTGVKPPALTFAQNGTFPVTLKAFSPAGCMSSITKPLVVNNLGNIANVITPNGDGKNDTFVVGVANARIEIFNRWGKRLFISENYADNWGKDIINGTYYYTLTLPTGDVCKGWIEVLQ